MSERQRAHFFVHFHFVSLPAIFFPPFHHSYMPTISPFFNYQCSPFSLHIFPSFPYPPPSFRLPLRKYKIEAPILARYVPNTHILPELHVPNFWLPQLIKVVLTSYCHTLQQFHLILLRFIYIFSQPLEQLITRQQGYHYMSETMFFIILFFLIFLYLCFVFFAGEICTARNGTCCMGKSQ